MRILKTVWIAGLLIVTGTTVTAQNSNPLLGKWEATYEEKGKTTHLTYEFEDDNGELVCYTRRIADGKGNGKEYHSLALKKVKFKNGKGTAIYPLEDGDDNYEVKASLELKDSHTLHISFSNWGYSHNEVWRRKQ